MKTIQFIVLIFIVTCLTQCIRETTFPDEYNLSIQNNYGVNVVVEVWEGEELSYNEGNVEGKDLLKVLPTAAGVRLINNSTTTNTGLKFTDEQNFIIVFGIVDGGNVYVNHQAYPGLKADTTITINSNGFFE